MLFWTTIKVALASLFSNKLRSILAMLGIIIGVAAVISMLALGAGARRDVLKRIASMGTDLLIIRPRWRNNQGVRLEQRQNLTVADAQALVEELPSIRQVAPVSQRQAQIKYLNQNVRSNVIGTTVTYFPIRNYEIEHGRSFTEGEVEREARVAVLGPSTVETLFGEELPFGKTIKVNGINFEVVGVLKSKGDRGWYNPDAVVFVPYSVAMKRLFGRSWLNEIDIQAESADALGRVQAEASTVLRRRHRLQSGHENDFWVRNQADIIEQRTDTTRTFTILLGGIAGVSLLVGGIGIMNIMLVTVTERTREIGVRKAIGARDRDILRQFFIEALLMSGLGGAIGVGLGVGLAALLGTIEGFSTTVELRSVILALSFASAVGVFFGYYPARRAAKLDPIDALRYE